VTKADLAYMRIRQQILDGELRPGATLDQEALAAGLGLSTTPVREALRRLEAERLVITRAHRDTAVAPLSVKTVEEVYAVRLSLDPLAVALATAQTSPEEKAAIMTLTRTFPVADDPVDQVSANRYLHRSIYASCGNTMLIELLDGLWDLSDRYRLIALRDSDLGQAPHDEHIAIVEAIVDGDPGRASELMREHLANSLQRIRAAAAS
jgi:DNA-binding GntR family transcriptional regulator